MSRPSFRARPIDINVALAIIRDADVINSDEQVVAREVTHAHKNLDKDNEEVLTKPVDKQTSKDGKDKEIPIPEIRAVSTYEQDYRPNYRKSTTYLRGATFGAPPPETVEYDLDNDDEDWLEKYNDGQNRLPAEKLEIMMWKLERACGDANDVASAERAAEATEKGQIISYQDKCAMAASTKALPKAKAIELLEEVSGRPALLDAVYEYWANKRKTTGKPCLRRLQPPPAPNDANPFNVFRQREKTNRPQTRRRRENDAASYEKLRQIRRHMECAYAVVELQLRREEKKLERARCEVDAQALAIKLKHEPRTLHEEIEAEFAARPSAKALTQRELEWDATKPFTLPLSRVEICFGSDGAYHLGGERYREQMDRDAHRGGHDKKSKKRRREELAMAAMAPAAYSGGGGGFGGGFGAPPMYPAGFEPRPYRPSIPVEPVTPYQPPPEIPDIEMIFAQTPKMNTLREFVLPLGLHKQRCRPRVARGGRIVFDLKDPLSREPYFDGGPGPDGLPADPDEDEDDENVTPSHAMMPRVRV